MKNILNGKIQIFIIIIYYQLLFNTNNYLLPIIIYYQLLFTTNNYLLTIYKKPIYKTYL